MSIRAKEQYKTACAAVHHAFDPETPIHGEGEADIREDFYLEVLDGLGLLTQGKTLVDLGAGFSRFAPLASQFGMTVNLVDDFGGGGGIDPRDAERTKNTLSRLRNELKLNIFEEDFLTKPLPFADATVDIVTCFHSLEHWHHSPRKLFLEIQRVVKPGGYIFFATPNAVNFRKRVWVALGKSNLPVLQDWYGQEPVWRGHVREPILADLHNIFEWNNFRVEKSYGRNFYARDSRALSFIPRPLRHLLVQTSARIFQFFPTLCSDIHVVGRKR